MEPLRRGAGVTSFVIAKYNELSQRTVKSEVYSLI